MDENNTGSGTDAEPIPNKRKKGKIIGIVILVVLLIGGAFFMYQYQQNKKTESLDNYREQLGGYVVRSLVVAIEAEEIVATYIDVWHSAIFDDPVTIDGQMYWDFNTALAAQYESFRSDGTLETLNVSFDKANSLMKELKNTPEEFELEYEAAVDISDALNDFVSLAKNPSGSYRNYSQESNSKSSELASAIQKLQNLLD